MIKISTGLTGFDKTIDMLRLGDNVVWQVDSIKDYKKIVAPYITQAKNEGRHLIYIRFGNHEPVIDELEQVSLYHIDAFLGFESFATEIHNIITAEGLEAFYVFDCLTDLLRFWYSDLMIGNFFKVTCPYLYTLDTIAYFAVIRNTHTFETIARIRETTQLLLDLYNIEGDLYIHPLKVWQRYSPTMFFPHLIQDNGTVCITASAKAAELFSSFDWNNERLDYWDVTINKAKEALNLDEETQQKMKELLISILIGKDSRMFELCNQYFKLKDILKIASREIGTGYIGGKSVGMLLSRRIITSEEEYKAYFKPYMESHDSFYIGSDVFYTYIVQNDWWELRTRQKTEEGYFSLAQELHDKLLEGTFSESIEDEFIHMLEYFGQSPIIVRSSSLLEDNFGNAFAGKYESVFCVNQGTPSKRLQEFEQAIRHVYASTMNVDALNYRINRGLAEKDEQMAILVQRVSGDYYGKYFFPHIAGVGNSSNLYVWDKNMDMDAGMLRLVFGLGTRAVDRVIGDYVRIVALDEPTRLPLMASEDEKKFSQHKADVLNLETNTLTTIDLDDILTNDIAVPKTLFASQDFEEASRLRALGYYDRPVPYTLNFKKLLSQTQFPVIMKKLLQLLSEKYDYPVDIEFTGNFTSENNFKFNLIQCRPLQTKGLGKTVEIPKLHNPNDCFFYSKGNFMGGNVRLSIDYVVFIDVKEYLSCTEKEKYSIARQIGIINQALKNTSSLLIGPGRWGTTTPSLGVPVHFTELSNMSVICEVAYGSEGFMPELSYGSHFFQDLVETGIFYIALFKDQETVNFNPEYILNRENLYPSLCPEANFENVIKVIQTESLQVYSDIIKQEVLCCFNKSKNK
ncbi:PEP/pyruvate-binding domain-containing protein [Anaerosacchariphilus polymeriproducens]|uniref:Pyruvate kinase n=1 Tax=Anaerosacchariphilus polymeriproducens TaxID=1812858 RepID=A0A371AZ33_9FIRM|nr:PEP/pyruvate-binding domain-containing protein [Anaerosacchariphilus polymeriproducens]RDU24740.1 pyruvate kinase [Anaerosacchariphilus polymeriproducens]